ncbi:uncharacterized protein M421DRAFT_416269 [Didymella exigua CBS 183.55]|uniref:Uncharacterized protein n=1 Tax=Didymella exigua CBS 183.55 TaxID=1150837 RepID=A0A6A5RYN7_9PLEO|nr:uncharacterized protein M421DRAFT_416269 [Didymella exigua CBS 183.55]KAF1932649.1 hypothetical protein M421DRAFT_416269 [Didymella exigua CBS 183.55]
MLSKSRGYFRRTAALWRSFRAYQTSRRALGDKLTRCTTTSHVPLELSVCQAVILLVDGMLALAVFSLTEGERESKNLKNQTM